MNKIEPQYVTFEITKLLKEKDFNEMCRVFWGYDCTEEKNILIEENSPSFINNRENNNLAAPEIWQVVEWLRLEYGIWIECRHITTFNINRFHVIIWDYKDKSDYKTIHCGNGIGYKVWDTPQEAYLAAFDYVLKELI